MFLKATRKTNEQKKSLFMAKSDIILSNNLRTTSLRFIALVTRQLKFDLNNRAKDSKLNEHDVVAMVTRNMKIHSNTVFGKW